MLIGLLDCDSHNFPSLPLMKISAFYKLKGDYVEFICYVLTNYNTTHEEDMLRVSLLQDLGFAPYIMVYRKPTAPLITRKLQRWCNNRILYKSCTFKDFLGDTYEL